MTFSERQNRWHLVLAFTVLGIGISACQNTDPDPCAQGVSIAGADGSALDITANTRTEFTADLELCTDDANAKLDYQFEWRYDANGDGAIDGDELEPASYARTFSVIECAADAKSHALELKAVKIQTEEAESETDSEDNALTSTYTLNVIKRSEAIVRPTCVNTSIAAIQNMENVVEPADYEPFNEVATCLVEYTSDNVCDFQADYAAALALAVKFSGTFQDRFEKRNSMTAAEALGIYETEVIPMLDRLLVVAQKAPDNFTFTISGRGRFRGFGDLTYLEGDESVHFNMQGINDKTDVLAFASIIHIIKGFGEMLFAYNGLVDYFLQIPRLDTIDYLYPRRSLIARIEADPEFGNLAGENGEEGTDRLLTARGEFMDSIIAFQKAIQHLMAEKDPQGLHLFRYWDCGKDGLCDCTLPENNYLACPNEQADYPGPDEGEGDGKYTVGKSSDEPGESIGSDRVENPDIQAQHVEGGDLESLQENLVFILENLRGPDALDLDEFAGAPVRSLMRGVALPYPEIRLSQWFLSPTSLREVMPLYSRSKGDVLFDLEVEPFTDNGMDGKFSVDEQTPDDKNLRGLASDERGYDKILNPDPNWDDFDPFCNPYCNWTDDLDNDGDGAADGADEGMNGFVADIGVENNFVFDYVDLNGDRLHQADEPHEPFEDTGVIDINGTRVGASDGGWNRADRAHPWPTGDDIGPRQINATDPANGERDASTGVDRDNVTRAAFASQENGEVPAGFDYKGLVDNYYFFMPDPTFSGVLVFPDDVQSIKDGELLTDNAKLMRFFNKGLELLEIVGIREGNAHPCKVGDCSNP